MCVDWQLVGWLLVMVFMAVLSVVCFVLCQCCVSAGAVVCGVCGRVELYGYEVVWI
jgi:hypothetical protein